MSEQIPSRTNDDGLRVAVPWGLSHYIPLNGFHPLYRALVDHAPDNVQISSWDNVSLYETFVRDKQLRNETVESARRQEQKNRKGRPGKVEKKYLEYFWPPNQVLTEQLPGDIELHHTAPFPSMTRPFVFHCESFAPIFFPFTQQGGGQFEHHAQLREHYRRIFTSPLCLGIFSHIPETLNGIRRFFNDPEIDRKLFASRMGLSEVALAGAEIDKPPPTDYARFLFVNSANQNPGNFFRRGGHIVLRFWEKFRRDGRQGLLMLRCARPSDSDLQDYGVDVRFLIQETGHSVIWVQDYLTNHEMNALMASAHFFLLPSTSLHSVSIMQSMSLGAVPVISDAIGTEQYIQDGENGLVLKGVRETLWRRDPQTGIFVDQYRKTPELDAHLTEQMYERINVYLNDPVKYQALRMRTQTHAGEAFSGKKFSREFWVHVNELYIQYRQTMERLPSRRLDAILEDSLLATKEWPRVFEGATQPLLRIFTGNYFVSELGGSFILTPRRIITSVNDRSVLAQFFDCSAPPAVFSKNITGLSGGFLPKCHDDEVNRSTSVTRFFSHVLMPFPKLHHFASGMLKRFRRLQIHLVRRKRYIAFRYWARRSINADVQLVSEGVFGYNVVRFFHRYYGYPQASGPFKPDDEIKGRYCRYPCALSSKRIIYMIAHGKDKEN